VTTGALHYMGFFFLLGGCAFVGVLCRVSLWTLLGERLTRKLRAAAFTAMLRQPAAFFDAPENGVGRLTTRLAADAAQVKGASGEAIGSLVECVGAIGAAMGIAFSASWREALVLLGVFPLLLVGGIFEFRSVASAGRAGGAAALEEAGQQLSEAVTGVRTVSAYNLQQRTVTAFTAALRLPRNAGMRRGAVQAAGQAFQRAMLMCAYSLAFWAGAKFIANGQLEFQVGPSSGGCRGSARCFIPSFPAAPFSGADPHVPCHHAVGRGRRPHSQPGA